MSSIRSRSKSSPDPPTSSSSTPPRDQSKTEEALIEKQKPPPPPPSSSSLPQQALSQALTSTANLANLLPTGTLLAFQLLAPVFTKHGACDAATRLMTEGLLLVLAASCFLASFTDSFKSADGRIYYGFATPRGMWLFDFDADLTTPAPALPDLSRYRLRVIDLVHAVLSVLVFASVVLLDPNVVGCFYPQPAAETQEVLDALPLGVGLMCGFFFMIFPTRRHGIGYPVTGGNGR